MPGKKKQMNNAVYTVFCSLKSGVNVILGSLTFRQHQLCKKICRKFFLQNFNYKGICLV